MTNDEKYIKRCIKLSEMSIIQDGAPFAAIVTKNNQVIASSTNNASEKVSDHAEILVMHKASLKLKTKDLSDCVLYSNCEPCPMCSFMAREYKFKKIVFALPSPFVGGYSKWKILQDKELSQFKPFFNSPPKIISGLLESEAKAVFNKTPLWMFGSKARRDKRNKAKT